MSVRRRCLRDEKVWNSGLECERRRKHLRRIDDTYIEIDEWLVVEGGYCLYGLKVDLMLQSTMMTSRFNPS
jgi:hypothetical protein